MQKKFNSLFNLELSELCFGGASLSGSGGGYGFGDITEKEAVELVHMALDYGVNLFDTAPIYGFGESEKRLGLALKGKEAYVISKAGVSWHENKRVNMTNDPKTILLQLETSLKDLKRECIDMYLVHWPDKNIPLEETLEVYTKAKQMGKINKIGLCNTNFTELEIGNSICKIDVLQSESNIFNNAFKDLGNIDKAYKLGWGTFDKGILSGSVTLDRKFDKSDCRSWAPWWKKSNWKEKVLFVEKLSLYLKDQPFSLLEMAIGFSLLINQVDSVICGLKNKKQLEEILLAFNNLPNREFLLEGIKFANK